MTLTKKMAIGVLTLLMLVFIGTYLITLRNDREFFIEQMNGNAQDTATSLGLSLSQSLADKDRAMMLAMVEAVFDRGYFAMIEVRDIKGKLLVSRYAPLRPKTAPDWFVNLMDWPVVVQSSAVMNGWNQQGEVLVTSDITYACSALWRNAVDLFYWYLFFAVISVIASMLFLRWLMKPLKRVTKQAEAICDRQFPVETIIPKTLELKQLTLAMNHMVNRVRHSFEEQLQQMEILRCQAFIDPLTNMGNRRYFMQQLSELLGNDEEFTPGFILLIAVDGLDELNETRGYQQGDQVIIDLGKCCLSYWGMVRNVIMARISGSNFAVIVRGENQDLFLSQCEDFNRKLQTLYYGEFPCKIYLAATSYTLHQSFRALLTEADNVLIEARGKNENFAFSHSLSTTVQRTIAAQSIEEAINQHALKLYAQKVVNARGEVFHEEIFLRLIRNDEEIPAGRFMPIAEQANIAHLVDRCVLTEIIDNDVLAQRIVALNLARTTITDEKFKQDYLDKLASLSLDQRNNLHLEISEHMVIDYFAEVMTFMKEARQLGIKTGVDQVGTRFSPMHYLNQLPISYLKLHGSLIQDVDENQNKQFFIHYFCEMATILDFQVIATQVETATQWEALQSLRMKWGQGRFLSNAISIPTNGKIKPD